MPVVNRPQIVRLDAGPRDSAIVARPPQIIDRRQREVVENPRPIEERKDVVLQEEEQKEQPINIIVRNDLL